MKIIFKYSFFIPIFAKIRKERGHKSLLCLFMEKYYWEAMSTAEEKITALLDEIIQDSTLFLIDLYIRPTSNIKIFLDGDEGVNVETISKIHRALYKKIEESEIYEDGSYSLEVSSAGIGQPLKLFRQYKKNVGRQVEVTLNDEHTSKEAGLLKEVFEDHIVITYEEGKKKKDKVLITKEIPFENIKETIVQTVF